MLLKLRLKCLFRKKKHTLFKKIITYRWRELSDPRLPVISARRCRLGQACFRLCGLCLRRLCRRGDLRAGRLSSRAARRCKADTEVSSIKHFRQGWDVFIYLCAYVISQQLTIDIIFSPNRSQPNLKTTARNTCQLYSSRTTFKIYLNFQIHLQRQK